MRVTGSRCKCAECGDFFNSTTAFDKHRAGPYDRPPFRWCLSEFAMEVVGMAKNADGFWASKLFGDAKTRAFAPGVVRVVAGIHG